MQMNRRDPHSGVWTMLSTLRSHAQSKTISMMAIADIAFSPLRHLVSERSALRLKRVTSTNRCEVFLLNHKAALEPSDPVALTHWQTHATPMVPRAGAHDEPSSRQDATVGVGAAVCDCTAMDPHRFWTNCGSP